MNSFRISLVISFFATFTLLGDPPQEKKPATRIATIKLNDGTTVRGSVKGLKDGFYFIDTLALGELKISAQRILGISYEPPAASDEAKTAKADAAPTPPKPALPADVPAVGNAEMQDMMKQMLGNPEIMKLIEQLSQDPSVQKMVEDPELQKAVNSGNYLQLLQHPTVRSLMDNPTVQQITGEVKGEKAAGADEGTK